MSLNTSLSRFPNRPRRSRMLVGAPLLAFGLVFWLGNGHSAEPNSGAESPGAQQFTSMARHPETGVTLGTKDTVSHPGGLGPKMVVLPRAPADGYLMGSPESEAGRDKTDEAQHRVTIPYWWAMSETHVTFNDWDACVRGGGCRSNPDPRAMFGNGRMPVIRISHNDAREYVAWLNGTLGIKDNAHAMWPYRYRLPSEIETEYAARAGNAGPFGFALQDGQEPNISPKLANYNWGTSYEGSDTKKWPKASTVVKTYPANAYGLYEMTGNVWSWQADCYTTDRSRVGDLQGLAYRDKDEVPSPACAKRTLRGGSWSDGARDARSANRSGSFANSRYSDVGFRLARTLPSGN